MNAKKRPGPWGGGRAAQQNGTNSLTNCKSIIPDSPPKINLEARRRYRAALRLVARRLAHYGRRRYRLAKTAMGLKSDVSMFDLDTAGLIDLAAIIKGEPDDQ